jgi:protein-S-isoprenylcysteine O-methyltransferase Ste14
MFLLDYKPPKTLRFLFIIHYAPLLLIILIGPITALYNIWQIPTPQLITIISGVFIFLAGTYLYFKWEIFWYRVYKGQLVTTGIFKYIRHPHYTSLIIVAFGLSLFFYSIASLIIAIISLPIMIASIFDEERLLIKQYGNKYKQFMKDTPWRMIPGLF